jgi:hypothetical protein
VENKYSNGTFLNIFNIEKDFKEQKFLLYGQFSYWKILFMVFYTFYKYKVIKFTKLDMSYFFIPLKLFFRDYRKGTIILSKLVNLIQSRRFL